MTGAAPRNCKHGAFGVAVVLAAAAFTGHVDRAAAAAHSPARAQGSLPASIQGLELSPVVARSASKTWLQARRSHHVTALIADPTRLGSPLFRRLRTAAWASGLRVLIPVSARTRERGAAACVRLGQDGSPCFLLAPTSAVAVRLSAIPGSIVAVRLPNLAAFQRLGRSSHGRIVGIVPLRLSAGTGAWLKAIALARRNPNLDLAVAAVGAQGAKVVVTFEKLLNVKTVAGVDPSADPRSGTSPGSGGGDIPGGGGSSDGGGGGGAPADTLAPTTPLGLSETSATTTSITISWSPSTDNVAVTGYGVTLGGTATSTPQTNTTFVGLACGTTYAVTVDAFDAAGNHSAKSGVAIATSACSGGGGIADTQAPSSPSGIHSSGATNTSISIAWTASTDNVGVAGYSLSRDGTRVATTVECCVHVYGTQLRDVVLARRERLRSCRQHLQPGLRDNGALDKRLRHSASPSGRRRNICVGLSCDGRLRLERMHCCSPVQKLRSRVPRCAARPNRRGRGRVIRFADDRRRLLEDIGQ